MISLDECALRAANAQAGLEAVSCQQTCELVKDMSTTSDGVQDSACMYRCHLTSLIEDVAEDDAEDFCWLLRRIVLKGARFCPRTGAPVQQLHHHIMNEAETLSGGQACENQAMLVVIPSHSCVLDKSRLS